MLKLVVPGKIMNAHSRAEEERTSFIAPIVKTIAMTASLCSLLEPDRP
jgi:hypothetical protein